VWCDTEDDSDTEPSSPSRSPLSVETNDSLQSVAQSVLPTKDVVRETPSRDDVVLILPLAISALAAAKAAARQLSIPYTKSLELHYLDLIAIIHGEELSDAGTFGLSMGQWRVRLWSLFASIPFKVLRSALLGTLHQQYVNKTDIVFQETFHRDSTWMLRAQEQSTPAIYLRPLVDESGRPPTANEFSHVISVLRRYAEGTDLNTAVKIDNAFRNGEVSTLDSLRRGEHYYFEGHQERVKKLWTWCKAISLQCKAIPAARRDQPMPRAITYCGYSVYISRREVQYQKRSSTAWLVSLVETTFRVLFPDRRFFLPLYCIAYLGREEELQLAERAFTRCTYSDFKYGGLCVTSASRIPPPSPLNWSKLEAWRSENTPCEVNARMTLRQTDEGGNVLSVMSEAEQEKRQSIALPLRGERSWQSNSELL
jgi:hypothetical protein